MIFEPDSGGHRLHFVRLIAQGLIERGLTPVWVTAPPATRSQQAEIHLGDLLDHMVVDCSLAPPGPGLRGALSRFNQLRRLAKQISGCIYVPYADPMPQLAALPLVWPQTAARVEGLMLRARFAYPRERLRDIALQAFARNGAVRSPWSRLFFLDPLAVEALGEGFQDSLMPEPVEQWDPMPSDGARTILGLPPADLLVTLVGAIGHRKGAVELARAFSAADLDAGVHLAFIGPIDDAIRLELAMWAQQDHRIHILDRHLDAKDFWLAMCAGDIVSAPYRNHVGSSGIIARAAYLDRAVLASDVGWIGEATRRFGLGATADPSDRASFAASLEELVRGYGQRTRSALADEFVAFNTPENFTQRWLEGLDAEG